MLSIGVFLFTSWTPSSSPAPGHVIGAVRLGAHPAMSTDGPTPTVQDAPAVQLADALLSNAANDVVYRRAEFWDRGSATLLEVINVLGRWETADEWITRTEFREVEKAREQTEGQAWTQKRYEMAQRLKLAERVALVSNCKRLPFRNSELAASVGLTCDDFNQIPVRDVACNIVFDCLAQSKNGLLEPGVIKSRRDAWLVGGSLNEALLGVDLLKARVLVIISWVLFGKFNFIGILVFLKILSDTTGAGSELFAFLLQRQDAVLAAMVTAGAMWYVGEQQQI